MTWPSSGEEEDSSGISRKLLHVTTTSTTFTTAMLQRRRPPGFTAVIAGVTLVIVMAHQASAQDNFDAPPPSNPYGTFSVVDRNDEPLSPCIYRSGKILIFLSEPMTVRWNTEVMPANATALFLALVPTFPDYPIVPLVDPTFTANATFRPNPTTPSLSSYRPATTVVPASMGSVDLVIPKGLPLGFAYRLEGGFLTVNPATLPPSSEAPPPATPPTSSLSVAPTYLHAASASLPHILLDALPAIEATSDISYTCERDDVNDGFKAPLPILLPSIFAPLTLIIVLCFLAFLRSRSKRRKMNKGKQWADGPRHPSNLTFYQRYGPGWVVDGDAWSEVFSRQGPPAAVAAKASDDAEAEERDKAAGDAPPGAASSDEDDDDNTEDEDVTDDDPGSDTSSNIEEDRHWRWGLPRRLGSRASASAIVVDSGHASRRAASSTRSTGLTPPSPAAMPFASRERLKGWDEEMGGASADTTTSVMGTSAEDDRPGVSMATSFEDLQPSVLDPPAPPRRKKRRSKAPGTKKNPTKKRGGAWTWSASRSRSRSVAPRASQQALADADQIDAYAAPGPAVPQPIRDDAGNVVGTVVITVGAVPDRFRGGSSRWQPPRNPPPNHRYYVGLPHRADPARTDEVDLVRGEVVVVERYFEDGWVLVRRENPNAIYNLTRAKGGAAAAALLRTLPGAAGDPVPPVPKLVKKASGPGVTASPALGASPAGSLQKSPSCQPSLLALTGPASGATTTAAVDVNRTPSTGSGTSDATVSDATAVGGAAPEKLPTGGDVTPPAAPTGSTEGGSPSSGYTIAVVEQQPHPPAPAPATLPAIDEELASPTPVRAVPASVFEAVKPSTGSPPPPSGAAVPRTPPVAPRKSPRPPGDLTLPAPAPSPPVTTPTPPAVARKSPRIPADLMLPAAAAAQPWNILKWGGAAAVGGAKEPEWDEMPMGAGTGRGVVPLLCLVPITEEHVLFVARKPETTTQAGAQVTGGNVTVA
ncbi:hypothetical protein HDU96_008424 [Phlyctochytrium bullatum]|nr:hypothetical protein HDU96_008424 [Phlyctochytrium bullatum]